MVEHRRRRSRLRRVLLWTVVAAVALPCLAFGVGYLTFTLPAPIDAVNKQITMVQFADGSPLAPLIPRDGNRTKVPIEAVPEHVRHAVLAAEDRSFYSNPGFDAIGIVRAAWNQLRGGRGGGSTITQQYVKNALLGDEQTLWRKYEELVLAVKISQERPKDQILGDYLNVIYFGRGAYGVQEAARVYFAKDVQDLTPSEGALLAGVIQSPNRWDPAVNPGKARERWTFVLDGMVEEGWLSAADRAAAPFPATIPRKDASGGMPIDSNGHIVSAVLAELDALGITEQELSHDGLRITTTLDAAEQRVVAEAVHERLAGQPDDVRAAMVAIDPASGGVLAYFGGDNGLGIDYTRTRRLAGATFAPFVVLAGLLQPSPIGLRASFAGMPVPGLRNPPGADCDRCDLQEAMTIGNSVVFNILAKVVGGPAVAAAARAAGVTAPLDNANEGIALGNKEVSVWEMASAYATIAAGGVWRPPHLVASVTTATGQVLYQAQDRGEQRFPRAVAGTVAASMLGVAGHEGLMLPDRRPVAVRTGTVPSRFDGETNDAWTAGFTPDVAAAVWMGTDMNTPIRADGRPIEGRTVPGAIWQQFMTDAHGAVGW